MKDKIIIIAFCFMLSFFLLLSMAMPDKEISENENRTLSQFPDLNSEALLSGSFMDEFEIYQSDQFPLRDMWVSVKNTMDVALGRRDNGKVYFGKDGWLFNMEQIDDKQLDINLGYMEEFFSEVKTRSPEISIQVLPAPTAASVVSNMLPLYAPVNDEEDVIKDLSQRLSGLAEVCSAAERLQEAWKKEEEVYYKTDHHWTTLGAYYAYTCWAETAGQTPALRTDFQEETVSEDFYGTNHSKANLPWTTPDTIQVFRPVKEQNYKMTVEDGEDTLVFPDLYDESYLSSKDKYSYFLSGNNPVVTIETDTHNGKEILIIKDSYAHCFIPFLTGHYERITAVDLRYYKDGLGRFFEEGEEGNESSQITDILVLYNITKLSSDRNIYYMQF